jgi:hypothetical protein
MTSSQKGKNWTIHTLEAEEEVLDYAAATSGINTRKVDIQQGMAYFTRTRFVPILCAARAHKRQF